jgi:carbon-monoxide dehydrogenase medium subunit
VTVDDAGACTAAELVLLRVAPTPFRADVADLLLGTHLDAEALDAVAGACDGLAPPDDVEASGVHRRRVAAVLARRALQDAHARAIAKESA